MTLPPFILPADIAARLGQTFTPAQTAQAQAFAEDASAVIRDHIRQQVTAVVGATMDIEAPDGPWLTFPQRPVTLVTSVTVNSQPVENFTQIGDRLYRLYGWRWPSVQVIPPLALYGIKPLIHAVYNHGYAVVPDVIVAVCARMAMRAMDNPTGVSTGEGIDDYTGPRYAVSGTGCFLTDEDRKHLRRFRRGAFSVDMGTGFGG